MANDNPGSQLAALLIDSAVAAGLCRDMTVRSGDDVFAPQSAAGHVFVLKEGLIKLYYLVADGDEWTKSLIADSGVFGPTSAQETRIQFGAKALENCQLGRIPQDWLANEVAANSRIANSLAAFQAWLFERKRKREEDMLCLAAEDRYLSFVQNEPILTQRLVQKEIAAFLRITPVALSRIRKRLKVEGRLADET
ncbi:hypothetical protein BPTFM16_02603 [Altererythrobacter insulae]|nr:hypothetical protein BPTFM16_02603 [Altererythrobacter insulae]